MERRCKNCVAWKRDSADGICRGGGAPKAVITAKSDKNEYVLVWPRTNPEEYCSDFKEFTVEDKS